jgi:hypothetical protein
MQKYAIFLTAFIIAAVAGIALAASYIYSIINIASNAQQFGESSNPFEVFAIFFTPATVLSLIVAVLAGIGYRILGIVAVARHQTIAGGEKVLWILGFLFMGFVTGIVYLVLAKQRGLAI